MLAEERRQAIIDMLKQGNAVRVSDLSSQLGVSPVTIRRDLLRLEQEGLLQRTHGGALLPRHSATESSFAERLGMHAAEKLAIARAATRFLQSQQVVILDSGTTMLQLARVFPALADVTVITNDLRVAAELAERRPSVRVLLSGGSVIAGSQALVGPFAERTFQDVHADVSFISTVAISPEEGLTHPALEHVSVKRAMVRAGQRVVVLADSSKLGSTSTYTIAALSEIDAIVTDGGAPEEFLQAVNREGIEVILASVPTDERGEARRGI